MTVRSRLTTSGSQIGSHLSIAFGDRAPVRAALVSTGAQLAACTSLWMRFSRCGYMTIDVSTGQRDLAPADSRGWPAEARETVCHLAHDLCQPIAAIRALAYATPAEAEAPVLQRLRQISEEAAWIAEIVDDLLGGPRTSPLRRFDRTEIHELIRDVAASQRLTYTGRIVLHQASGSACYVAGSPAKLRRALANVVANATRAAGADGSVEADRQHAGGHGGHRNRRQWPWIRTHRPRAWHWPADCPARAGRMRRAHQLRAPSAGPDSSPAAAADHLWH